MMHAMCFISYLAVLTISLLLPRWGCWLESLSTVSRDRELTRGRSGQAYCQAHTAQCLLHEWMNRSTLAPNATVFSVVSLSEQQTLPIHMAFTKPENSTSSWIFMDISEIYLNEKNYKVVSGQKLVFWVIPQGLRKSYGTYLSLFGLSIPTFPTSITIFHLK